MRVGLVLGAGGVMGGAWLTGGLEAIARRTGWDAGSADVIVGTSAGAMIGSLTAAGVPPWFMVAHSAGETFQGVQGPDGRPASQASRSAGAVFRLHRGMPSVGPASLRMGLRTLTRPLEHTPTQLLAGWLPGGFISTEPLKETVRRVVRSGWVEHPAFWAMATDLHTGKRVPFGREDAPPADLADAVAASCSIPAFYRPVDIGGRRYIDGGVCSTSNLDLVNGHGLDVVICLNPTSSRDRKRSLHPLDMALSWTRSASGRRLGHEARKVREQGTEVVLIQPTAADHEVMGRNLMDGRRRQEAIERALETVGDQLEAPGVHELVSDLPRGEPHKVKQPPGPPSRWPELVPAIRAGARAA